MSNNYLYLSSPDNEQGWVVRHLVFETEEELNEAIGEQQRELSQRVAKIDWHGSPMQSGTVLVEGKDFEMKWQQLWLLGGWCNCEEDAYNRTAEEYRRIVAVPIAVTIKN